MNRKTLERLKQNPHYKISPQQYAEPMSDEDRVVEFGTLNSNTLPMNRHQTQPTRVTRKGKNEKIS